MARSASRRAVPKTIQVINTLMEELRQGDFDPAHPFATELSIRQRFNVSSTIAASVLRELARRGLVYRRRSKGTFVNLQRLKRSRNLGVLIYN